MECSCCGEERTSSELTALLCHDDIKICRVCIGWLHERSGGVDVTPTLPVVDMSATKAFFERAGFEVRLYDDGFAFVTVADESMFDLSCIADLDVPANHAGCYIITADLDAWHAHMTSASLPVTPLADMPWGMREFALRDPSGNNIRIGHRLDV